MVLDIHIFYPDNGAIYRFLDIYSECYSTTNSDMIISLWEHFDPLYIDNYYFKLY